MVLEMRKRSRKKNQDWLYIKLLKVENKYKVYFTNTFTFPNKKYMHGGKYFIRLITSTVKK